MHLSVILPAYNEEGELPATLAGLESCLQDLASGVSWEWILVDNNSTDQTVEIAKKFGMRVVTESVNQISKARNRGASVARGEFFLFVDADTWVSKELFQSILGAIGSGNLCGGGALIQFRGKVSVSAKGMTGLWNWFSAITNIAAGSLIFCRSDAFREVGGFSEKVYAGEEVHLSRRLIRWGKSHGMPFKILWNAAPVQTSSRKLQWHHPVKIWAIHFSLAIFPFLMRSKRFCRFWYERPG